MSSSPSLDPGFRCSFCRAHPDAVAPRRADPGAAGYDLCAAEAAIIPPRARTAIDTGIILQFADPNVYARVAPRSGLALKHGIDTLAGVVDQSYRGTIRAILYNTGDEPFHIAKGDRIAQLIFERIHTPHLREITQDELEATERGAGGFGSTGV